MWFDVPPRKYKHFPTKLVGHHGFRFRNAKGQFRKFRKGSRLTLFIHTKSPQAFLDWLLYLKSPALPPPPITGTRKAHARGKAKPKPAAKPKPQRKAPKGLTKTQVKVLEKAIEIQKAKRTAARRKLAKTKAKVKALAQWVNAESIIDDLESRYDNLTYDRQLTGFRYQGKGPYYGTFWNDRMITPFEARSLFMYVVKDVTGYKGDEPTYVVASMHVKWKGHTNEIAKILLEDYTKERVLLPDGRRVYRTNLERLKFMLFGKGGGEDAIMEYVGIKFSKAGPPKRKHINPNKKKK